MTTTKEHRVIRREDHPDERVEATDFAIDDQYLYLYDDNRGEGEQTVAVFPPAHWSGIRVE